MRTLIRFNFRRLVQHRVRTLLSISGVAIGAALVVAVLTLLGSLTGSVTSFVTDLSGFSDLEVTAVADKGFDESLFFRIKDAAGVSAAVPVVRTRALIDRRPVLVLGLDQRAQALRTNLSNQQKALIKSRADKPGIFIGGSLAKQIGASAGSSVSVYSGGGTVRVPVLGVISSQGADFNEGRFALAPIPLAQQILGKPGRIDSIFVIANKGVNADVLRSRLSVIAGSQAFVDSPSGRARQASSTTQSLKFGMVMGVIIALIVGGFLIFNTMSMAALERRRELATFRALGAERRSLLVVFLSEAALLGFVGSALGAAIGLAAAKKLVDSIPVFYASKLEVAVRLHVPVLAIPGALAAGVVASVVAAWLPGRSAVRVPPVDAMRPEGTLESLEQIQGVSWGPTLAGTALMIGGFLGANGGPPWMGFIGMGAFMAGTIVCTYGLTYPLARITAKLASWFGPVGRLAAASVERAPRRAWATSVAVVAGVGMVVAQAGATRNVNSSVSEVISSLRSIDLYVSGAPGTNLATDVLLPVALEDQLARISGVANVATNTFAFINYKGNRVLVQGIGHSLGAEPALTHLSIAERNRVEEGRAAVISSRFGELFNVKVGDQLALPTPTGIHRIKVISAVPSFTWDRGLISVGREKMTDWFGSLGVSDYLLTYGKGARPPEIRNEIRKLTAGSPIHVYLKGGSEYLDLIKGTVGQVNHLFDAMAAVVVAAATLAIFNALLISVLEREREFGILRALGTTRKQLRRMVGVEALALAVVGGVLGVEIGFVAHKAAIAAVARQGGMPIRYSFVLAPAGWAFLIGLGMAFLGSLQPAYRAGRLNIIEAIGYE